MNINLTFNDSYSFNTLAKRHKKSLSGRNLNKAPSLNSRRRPFWLPATSYYFLTVAIAFIVFFLVWGILIEGGDQTPWIPAGILSSIVLIGAVLLREIYLRNARRDYLRAKKQLDYNLRKFPKAKHRINKRKKFTLQQNSNMLNHIKEKSDAARILKRLPEVHLEVFEICNEYLNFTNNELKWINKKSPRYNALKKGHRKVRQVHKYHLLKWAEIETKKYTLEAKNRVTVVGKVESAQKALSVIESALRFYTADARLNESYEAIQEYIATIKIQKLIDSAEKAEFQAHIQEAINLYHDILFILKKDSEYIRDKKILIDKVETAISKIEYKNNVGMQNNKKPYIIDEEVND